MSTFRNTTTKRLDFPSSFLQDTFYRTYKTVDFFFRYIQTHKNIPRIPSCRPLKHHFLQRPERQINFPSVVENNKTMLQNKDSSTFKLAAITMDS